MLSTQWYPGHTGVTASHVWPHLVITTQLQPGLCGQLRLSHWSEVTGQHEDSTDSFWDRTSAPGRQESFLLLRDALPNRESVYHWNNRKPTHVQMPVLRTRAECGFMINLLTPKHWEMHRARHVVRTQNRFSKRNANDFKIIIINKSFTFILGMLYKHTNNGTNIFHSWWKPFLQTQLA